MPASKPSNNRSSRITGMRKSKHLNARFLNFKKEDYQRTEKDLHNEQDVEPVPDPPYLGPLGFKLNKGITQCFLIVKTSI